MPDSESPVIFYSWQSDLPRGTTRDPIRSALKTAIGKVGAYSAIEDSPRLDEDTASVAGTPEIAATIFRKIDRAAVFVADISMAARTVVNGQEKKRSPNANVLVELGYAAAKLGWQRIILIMNERFGGTKWLPFDLRNRRFPITFGLAEDAKDIESITARLAEEIVIALSDSLAAEYALVDEILRQLGPHARRLIQTLGRGHVITEKHATNNMVTRDDLALQQLLNLGVLRCVANESENRYGWSWTYLGRKCCEKIGVELPARIELPDWAGCPLSVTDLSMLDVIDGDRDLEVTRDLGALEAKGM